MLLQTRLARKVRSNPRLRPVGIAAYRLYTRVRPTGSGPKVIANSIPKAGTHLLMSMLDAWPGMHFSGMHFALGLDQPDTDEPREFQEFAKLVRRLRSGQYMSAHLPFRPAIARATEAANCRVLLSIRDPRAITLSLAMYLESNPRHPLHERMRREFPTLEQRLDAVIDGVEVTAGQPGMPSLAERLDRYLPWLDGPLSHLVRYEDLIGPLGGGSAEQQLATVRGVARFLGLPDDDGAVRPIADAVFSTKSATFRRGQIDSWREELSERFVLRIEQSCAAQLRRLGYAGDSAGTL